ncbi:MAG: hypothetical protein LBR07_07945 [Puniceicoccales bacterium]|jgi:hypothetical protein|nr:hypothetical protein [Puniceicoccales bacterium]
MTRSRKECPKSKKILAAATLLAAAANLDSGDLPSGEVTGGTGAGGVFGVTTLHAQTFGSPYVNSGNVAGGVSAKALTGGVGNDSWAFGSSYDVFKDRQQSASIGFLEIGPSYYYQTYHYSSRNKVATGGGMNNISFCGGAIRGGFYVPQSRSEFGALRIELEVDVYGDVSTPRNSSGYGYDSNYYNQYYYSQEYYNNYYNDYNAYYNGYADYYARKAARRNRALVVPVLVTFAYEFDLSPSLLLRTGVTLGMTYNYGKYYYYDGAFKSNTVSQSSFSYGFTTSFVVRLSESFFLDVTYRILVTNSVETGSMAYGNGSAYNSTYAGYYYYGSNAHATSVGHQFTCGVGYRF